jgi:sigma-B regulation protein RsbU (phosphoserine phosphatase)
MARAEAAVAINRRRKILLVEQERDQLVYWQTIFSSLGFEVLPARSLHEADELAAAGPSIVACGSTLVDGTGIDLFARLRARPAMALIYLVLLTTGGEEVIASLRAGANDCIDMSASYGEIRARLELAERVISLNEALRQKSTELSDAMAVIQRELQSAAALQAAMLPKPLDHLKYRVRSLYRPTDMLGGDMIGLTAVCEERIGFGLIDVVGHGTASALISCSLIRELMDRMTSLLQTGDAEAAMHSGRIAIVDLNRRYCALNLPGMYFTALAGVLDTRLGRIVYCQAGHPNLIDFDREYAWRELPDSGYPIGLLEGAEFTSRELQLEPGQMLLAVSDGMLRPHADDPAGSAALLRALPVMPTGPDLIMTALEEHATRVVEAERDDQSALLICCSL